MLEKLNEKNYWMLLVIVLGVVLLLFVVNRNLVDQMGEMQEKVSQGQEELVPSEVTFPQEEEPLTSQQVDPRNDLLAPVSTEATPTLILKKLTPSGNAQDPQSSSEPPEKTDILLQ